MTPKFPLQQLVEVTWIDSASRGRWDERGEYEKHDIVSCRTAGYEVRRSKRSIVIVQSQTTDDGCSNAMAIPMCAVTKIRKLK